MNAALAARVRQLDATLAKAERMTTGRQDGTTTRPHVVVTTKLYVYDDAGVARACLYDFGDAAAFVAFLGHGAEVRLGRSKTRVLWREGRELQSAAESYDAAAELMLRRHDEMTP
jgi:hypothetical protein